MVLTSGPFGKDCLLAVLLLRRLRELLLPSLSENRALFRVDLEVLAALGVFSALVDFLVSWRVLCVRCRLKRK